MAYVPSSACDLDVAYVPSSAYNLDSTYVSSSSSLLDNTSSSVTSSNIDNDDEDPPQPIPIPSTAPQLPRWVHSTREATGDLASDPTDQRQTHYQFQRTSSLSVQVSEKYDPDTFVEASSHPEWDAAIKEEYHSLLSNDTWDLVPLLIGRKLVIYKWVYISKYGPYGKVDKHKARLVTKCFSQVEGIDYTESFAPIAKMNFIHPVLSFVASYKWKVHQMDIKSAFFHGDLRE